jgi:hypothetical protein
MECVSDSTSKFLIMATVYEGLRSRTIESIINRYYDPATGEFLSIDPEVATTDQPYVFTNDDPLNGEDPLGDSWWNPFTWTAKDWEVAGGIAFGVVAVATGVGALGYGGLPVLAGSDLRSVT